MQASRQREFRITQTIKKEIAKIVDERIREAHVTKEDFSELKAIVRELAEAQKKSEERIGRLEKAVEELVEAQKKSEERIGRLEKAVEELAEAQKKSEERIGRLEKAVEELAEAQKRTEEEIRKLAIGLNNLRGEVGGLARSFGYAFENEAFRMLPKALKERYGIELSERLIRRELEGVEINILGFGKRNGVDVVVVGEAKTRLERMEVFDELEEKVKVVKEQYRDKEVVKVLVTHFATNRILQSAQQMGIIVIQSFEW